MKKVLFIIFILSQVVFANEQLALKSASKKEMALELVKFDSQYNDTKKIITYKFLIDFYDKTTYEYFILKRLILKLEDCLDFRWNIVFTGTLCSGKSTILDLFEKEKFNVIHEVAGDIIEQELKKDEAIRIVPWLGESQRLQFQYNVAKEQERRELAVADERIKFSDRGMPDGLAYLRNANKTDEFLKIFDFMHEFIKNSSYNLVFYFEPTDNLETTAIRTENDYFRMNIAKWIIQVYESLNYQLLVLPMMTIEERFAFIKLFVPQKDIVLEISAEHKIFAEILKKEYSLQVKAIKELSGGSCPQKPLLITTFDNKKYVFKFLTYNKKDLLFFLNFNLHLQNNGINIHKIYPTKTNQYFAKYSARTLYALFEYFEDFEMKPFENYNQVGNMLSRMDNIMINFQYPNPRQYKSRIQIMQEVLQKTFDASQMLDIVKIIQFLEIHKSSFLKLAIHNDLHSENVDTQFRIIDVGIAQYDWRINNFINIFFNRGNRKFNNLEVLQAITGYQAIAIKPLNFHEMLGILYVLKSRIYEDLILRNTTFLKGMDFGIIERFHYSA